MSAMQSQVRVARVVVMMAAMVLIRIVDMKHETNVFRVRALFFLSAAACVSALGLVYLKIDQKNDTKRTVTEKSQEVAGCASIRLIRHSTS